MSGLSSGGITSGGSSIDAAAVLKLLADPEALKANIAAYTAAKDAADAAVALVGKAKEITMLKAVAETDRETASGILAKAEKDAADTIAKANADADNIIAVAKAKAAESQAFADRANAEGTAASAAADKARSEAASILATAKAEAATIKASAEAMAAKVETDKTNIEKMSATVAAMKAKFDSKLKRLQAATADD